MREIRERVIHMIDEILFNRGALPKGSIYRTRRKLMRIAIYASKRNRET